MASLEERLKAASADYQKLQVDMSNVVDARQRLDAQLTENEMVKKVCWDRKLLCIVALANDTL